MKALNLYGVGDLRYDDLPMPERKKDEVLLKIKAAGICGSDIPRVFSKGTYHFPTVIGHEFAGEIVDAEDKALIGRGAAVFPVLPCYECTACKSGQYAQCKSYSYYGSRQDGGMAEYLAVKKDNLCFIPEGVSFAAAAMTEPAAVAYHAFRKCGAAAKDSLFIYGIGTIGFIIAQLARTAGVPRIVLAGRTAEKVKLAEKLGFEAIDIKSQSLGDFIASKGMDGFDVCIEGTGCSEGVATCIAAGHNFSRIVVMGNPVGEMKLSQDEYWQILRKELQLIGTWNSSRNEQQNDWQDALVAMQRGELSVEPLITHRFSLGDYRQAFELMRDKKEMYIKVMLLLGEEA